MTNDDTAKIPRAGSAVGLIFLPPKSGETAAHLVLTRRTLAVNSHKGQISLPGGRIDAEDSDVVATAIREAEEEIGLAPNRVTALGILPAVTALDSSLVHPVVLAAAIDAADLRANADEVAEIITAPWNCFRRAAAETFRFNIFGIWRESRMFRHAGAAVWGLTATILYDADLR